MRKQEDDHKVIRIMVMNSKVVTMGIFSLLGYPIIIRREIYLAVRLSLHLFGVFPCLEEKENGINTMFGP